MKKKNKGILIRMLLFVPLLTGAAWISGCDDSGVTTLQNDQEYFPLRVGSFQIYDVEEIIYQLGIPETLSYELKTHIADSFANNGGTFTYVIHRSRRNAGSETWEPEATWSARETGQEIIVNEESTPFVVLHFPARPGTSWNGNAYNDEINPNTNSGADLYEFSSRENTIEVNGLTFNDCITVLQEDNEEFIVYHDERREVYARGQGLIMKEKIQLHYCNDVDRNCVGEQVVDEGVIYRQKISGYGQL